MVFNKGELGVFSRMTQENRRTKDRVVIGFFQLYPDLLDCFEELDRCVSNDVQCFNLYITYQPDSMVTVTFSIKAHGVEVFDSLSFFGPTVDFASIELRRRLQGTQMEAIVTRLVGSTFYCFNTMHRAHRIRPDFVAVRLSVEFDVHKGIPRNAITIVI